MPAPTARPAHPDSPAAASYEGRPLAKPTEEVVDQGLAFDVVTLLDRRRVLGLLGLGGGALALGACGAAAGATGTTSSSPTAGTSATAASLTEIPDETAGPYPGDGSNGPDVLEESGVVRSDLTSSFGGPSGVAEGVPLTIELEVVDLAGGGVPFEDAAVYLWHCDREGRYSMYSSGVEGENYLRGVQVVDGAGLVRFTSIFPACYSGRWPHLHFEVYPDLASTTDSANAVATSQVALPEDVCDAVYATAGYESSVATRAQVSLDTDGVFGDDGGASQLGTVTGSVEDGLTVRLRVGVDTTTVPTGGGIAGGPGGPGGGPRP
ncbi:intradiol ring-cleavage dioxygenase [Aquipuribacter sp. SD81]|uniref:intradiol ring-cleavage dioxygenase n=1 Tax=Aquipuribacter sp. SD81 TaxID=3127703 RepID=UPI0030158EC7